MFGRRCVCPPGSYGRPHACCCDNGYATGDCGVRENLGVPYDLAVWEGDRPANDSAAAAEFEALYERYIGSDETIEPTERIVTYVAALLERFPDIDTDAGDDRQESSGRRSCRRHCIGIICRTHAQFSPTTAERHGASRMSVRGAVKELACAGRLPPEDAALD